MKEQTRKEMQQKMAECQMVASEVSWAEIEQTVSAQKRRTVIMPMRHKRISAAAAAVILIAGGCVFWMSRNQGQADGRLAKQAATTVNIIKPHEPSEIVAVPENELATCAVAIPCAQPITSLTLSAEETNRRLVSDAKTEDGMQTKESAQEGDNVRSFEQSAHPQYIPTPTTRSQATTRSRRTADTRLTAKVYLGNAMNGYTSSTLFTPMLMSAKPFGAYDDEMNGESGSPLHGDYSEFTTNIRHHQPLHFGVSLRYDISNRWSVESGLSYSRHKSDITHQSGNHETVMEQRLSYIGLPLNASYRIWSGKHLCFYASAGGMVEKMVKGSRSVRDITDGKPENSTTENISIRPLQFSVNCMAGVEFLINQSFSLYAEPGLSYHFDNGSPVPTIYQDEPQNLNLNIGLRFSFK